MCDLLYALTGIVVQVLLATAQLSLQANLIKRSIVNNLVIHLPYKKIYNGLPSLLKAMIKIIDYFKSGV